MSDVLSVACKVGHLLISDDAVTVETQTWTGKVETQSVARKDVVAVNQDVGHRAVIIYTHNGGILRAERVRETASVLDALGFGPKTSLLWAGCKQGYLSITPTMICVDPDIHIPCELVTGAMTVRQDKRKWDIAIHAKVCQLVRVSDLPVQDAERVIKQLGEWNEAMPRGTMHEVTEHYLSEGYTMMMRDDQGAQLVKKLAAGFESVTRTGGMTVYLGQGVTAGAASSRTVGVLHEAQHNVYVRADGSVMERIAAI